MRAATTPGAVSRRARAAVAALFVVNGATYTSLVPWFPVIKSGLGLSNTAFGTAVAAFPTAALLVGMLAGPLIARVGSARTAVLAGIVGALLLPLIAVAPSWSALAATLFALGATDAWTDAAMNAHGLRVQHRYGRSIINAFHAMWSLAAVGAGLVAAGAAGLGVGLAAHLGVVAGLLVVVSLVAWRFLLPGPETSVTPQVREAVPAGEDPAGLRVARRSTWRTAVPLLVLAALLMSASAIEDPTASWSAVYLRDQLGSGPFLAGLPFVAFQASMTAGRLLGDRVVDHLGPVRVARAGALLAAAALAGALGLAHPVAAVAGFALAGLGVSTLFPLAFAAAGSVPGVRSGDGIAVVGWLARLGFLAVPPSIGLIADATTIGTGLVLMPAAALVAAVLAGGLRGLHPRSSRCARGAPSGG